MHVQMLLGHITGVELSPIFLLTVVAFSIKKPSFVMSQHACKLQEFITVCNFYFHLVVTKLHAIFLAYLIYF